MHNPWDKLSEHFNGNKDLSQIDTDAADNILIAWPPIIEQINKYFNRGSETSILDYGCGAGAFCYKLWSLGYKNITGMDSSPGMIEKAKENYGEHIKFILGSADTPLSTPNVDVITSIMALQFVENVEDALRNLTNVLSPGGLLIFAVHNPATVRVSLEHEQSIFSDFDSVNHPTKGLILLAGQAIPIYIRSASEYDTVASNLGLTKVFEDYPPFTQEFLNQYSTDLPFDVPEYLIVGYRK